MSGAEPACDLSCNERHWAVDHITEWTTVIVDLEGYSRCEQLCRSPKVPDQKLICVVHLLIVHVTAFSLRLPRRLEVGEGGARRKDLNGVSGFGAPAK